MRLTKIRNRYLLALDGFLTAGAIYLLYAMRFESFRVPEEHLRTAFLFAAVTVPIRLAIYLLFGLYRRLWRYASLLELELIIAAGITAGLAAVPIGRWLLPHSGLATLRVPLSVLFNSTVLSIFIIAAPRLAMRLAEWQTMRRSREGAGRRVLIVGAGSAGRLVLRELFTSDHLSLCPAGFVDDDPHKQGMMISGVPVLGTLAQIPAVVREHEIDELLIAMPSAPGSVVRTVVRAGLDAGVRTRTVPGLYEIINGRVGVSAIRQVEIDDLLRRAPVKTDLARVGELARDRVVMVTGAGGSIGSELCRQLARLEPAALVLVGRGENPIFEIQNELRDEHPGLCLIPVIGDIRDRDRIHQLVRDHRPHAVFHAAAHKHVPLMELNPVEAITNNVMGTRNLVDACLAGDVPHFVLISTDKAVNPTNVMGASKRVAEHIVHAAASKHGRNYVAVRFGNVLGSRGSVVPTFVRQIKAGGPVTVTHPEMRRFFMTIPEAVQLVLQAGALGRGGGELFMLDMGEPVKVADLARDLIRLSGLQEGVDIEVVYSGVRPGEKLYEEMFFSDELASPTEHPKVLRAKKPPLDDRAGELIEELIATALANAPAAELRERLRGIVPDYTPQAQLPPISLMPTPGTSVPAQRKSGEQQRRISREIKVAAS